MIFFFFFFGLSRPYHRESEDIKRAVKEAVEDCSRPSFAAGSATGQLLLVLSGHSSGVALFSDPSICFGRKGPSDELMLVTILRQLCELPRGLQFGSGSSGGPAHGPMHAALPAADVVGGRRPALMRSREPSKAGNCLGCDTLESSWYSLREAPLRESQICVFEYCSLPLLLE